MESIQLRPVGFVHNGRIEIEDDFWGELSSTIVLSDDLPEDALDGIDGFSHAEIFFYFDRVRDEKIVTGARHPRNNPQWPRVGIFAQRGKNRPNRLGATIVRILGHQGRSLTVEGLDAIDGTPVLDIKPVMREFLPLAPVRQPVWVEELMADYWRKPGD